MFLRITKRLGAIGIGHGLATLINALFDYLLYVPAVWFMGGSAGYLMVPLSIIWDYRVIRLYSLDERDIFGFEALNKLKEKDAKTVVEKGQRLWALISYHLLFVYFSWRDPPRAFLLVRGRVPKEGLNLTDWKWLLAANFIGNALYLASLVPLVAYIKKFF